MRFIVNMTSNISLFSMPGLFGAAQNGGSGVIAGGDAGLFGFLNMILGPADPAAQGTDLAAKISALLANPTPEQEKALQALAQVLYKTSPELQAAVSPGAPAKDILNAFVGLGENAEVSGKPVPPSLLRDLTGAFSPELQQQDALIAKQPVKGQITDEQLAAFLQILQEPGQDGEKDSLLSRLLSDTTAEADDLLARLRESMAALDLSKGEVNRDVLATFKAEITEFLESKGYERPVIQKYLSALAKTLAPAPQPVETALQEKPATQKLMEIPQPLPLNADISAETGKESEIALFLKPHTTTPKQVPGMQTAQAPAQPLMNTEAVARPAAQTAATPLSFINNIAGNDAGLDAEGWQFSQGERGMPTGLPDAVSTEAVKTAGGNGFAQYLAAAQSGAPAHASRMASLQLVRNAQAKIDTMTLQLEPAELGRLHIRMTFEKDGTMKAHLSADRAETLALLQRDSVHLQRALHQAGFDMDDTALSFDLQHGGHNHGSSGETRDENGNGNGFTPMANAPETAPAELPLQAWNGYITPRGVNIMV